jgi:periplasmic copper chaperone A
MKPKTIMFAVAASALLVPAAVQAHISIHPNTVPAGAFATLYARVPGEQEGAHVTKVDVLFPPGITSAEYENVPGWSAKVVSEKVNPPIQTDQGPVSEQVSQVIWTWNGPLGAVNNAQFVLLPFSLAVPSSLAGRALEFRTVQTYSNGQVVHWIDASLDAEHPAPRINVTAPGGALADLAGKEAGPLAGQSATPAAAGTGAGRSGGASKGLALAALIVGALGLVAGGAALSVSARRVRAR